MSDRSEADRVLDYRAPERRAVTPFELFLLSLLPLLPFHFFLYVASRRGKGDELLPLLICLICLAVSLALVCTAAVAAVRRKQDRIAVCLGLLTVLFSVALFTMAVPRIIQAGSNRVPCASHLRQLGQGMMLYANDHNGQLPPSLEDLILLEDLHPSVLVCVNGPETPAKGSTPAEVRASLRKGGHISFVYLPTTRKASELGGDDVLAYEPLRYHETGSYVLFGDGRVEWLFAGQLGKVLADMAVATTRPSTRPATSPL